MKSNGSAGFGDENERHANNVVDFEVGKSKVHARVEKDQALKNAKRELLQEIESTFNAEIAREEKGLAEYLSHVKRVTETAIGRGQNPTETMDVGKLEHDIPLMLASRSTLKRQIQESVSRATSPDELTAIRKAYEVRLTDFRNDLVSLEELIAKGRAFR